MAHQKLCLIVGLFLCAAIIWAEDAPIELGKECNGIFDCGEHAFCDATSRLCRCQLGYKESSGRCQIFKCANSTECDAQFGEGTRCSSTSVCECDESFDLDPNNQTCFTLKKELDAKCVDPLDCGANVDCINSTCHCQFGYISATNNVNCEPFHCQDADDCCTFHEHSVCGELGLCVCDDQHQWILSPSTQNCTARYVPLNGTCGDDDQCGAHAVCGNGTCICALGFLPERPGNVNCLAATCRSDEFCGTNFDAHSVCAFNKICACDSDNSWILDHSTQECRPKKQFLNHSCQNDHNCGHGTYCNNSTGSCTCRFGKLPVKNQQDCVSFECKTDQQCLELDAHSQCRAFLCACNDNYEVEDALQKCVRDETPSYPINSFFSGPQLPWTIVGFVVGLFIGYYIVLPLLRRCFRAIKERRQQ